MGGYRAKAPVQVRALEVIKLKDSNNVTKTVVLVGNGKGVFRAVDPVKNSAWVEFGRGLPNAIVSDIHYETRNGKDLLYVSTLGRWCVVDQQCQPNPVDRGNCESGFRCGGSRGPSRAQFR